MSLTRDQTEAQLHIEAAMQESDADGLEDALMEAFAGGLHEGLVPQLIALAGARWHSRHEDVVLALQKLRPPQAVAALESLAVVRHPYLDYDEFFGLARKCTWALADIGTPEAREALTRLAGSNNSAIAGFAAKRLENWQHELPRKGVA